MGICGSVFRHLCGNRDNESNSTGSFDNIGIKPLGNSNDTNNKSGNIYVNQNVNQLEESFGATNLGYESESKATAVSEHDNPYENIFQAIALYNYTAKSDYEISFKKGDMMEIHKETTFHDGRDFWYKAFLTNPPNSRGYVPTQYVTKYLPMTQYAWYFGDIDRNTANNLLMSSQNRDSSFLVRESKKKDIKYVFSAIKDGKLSHAPIRSTTLEKKTLQEIVEQYQKNMSLKNICTRSDAPTTVGLSYQFADKWEIDISLIKIDFDKQLGEGEFSKVYYGKWKDSTEVAVKQLKDVTDSTIKEDLLKEAEILQKLQHHNLVKLYGVCTKTQPYSIIVEYMENGDLLNFLRNGAGNDFNQQQLINISSQVASGMAQLEERNIIHCDLAARNILVGKDDVYKVSDFGMAQLTNVPGEKMKYDKIATKWCAPEVLSDRDFSSKSDVWAFGICLVEIIERGMIPYPGFSNIQVREKINENYRMTKAIMPNCPDKLYKIMNDCWHQDPEERPSFLHLLNQLDNFWNDECPYNE